MLFVVAYDIADTRRLSKVARIMEDYGVRVQYSVFEAWADGVVMEVLMRRVLSEMKQDEDSVRIYPLCRACEENVEVMGDPVYEERPEESDVIIY